MEPLSSSSLRVMLLLASPESVSMCRLLRKKLVSFYHPTETQPCDRQDVADVVQYPDGYELGADFGDVNWGHAVDIPREAVASYEPCGWQTAPGLDAADAGPSTEGVVLQWRRTSVDSGDGSRHLFLQLVVGSLFCGSHHIFRYQLGNAVGLSPPSDISGVGKVACEVPDACAAPHVAATSPCSVTVTWSQPFSNGSFIINYVVEVAVVQSLPVRSGAAGAPSALSFSDCSASIDPLTARDVFRTLEDVSSSLVRTASRCTYPSLHSTQRSDGYGMHLSHIVDGLQPGQRCVFRIRARNAVGWAASGEASAVVQTWTHGQLILRTSVELLIVALPCPQVALSLDYVYVRLYVGVTVVPPVPPLAVSESDAVAMSNDSARVIVVAPPHHVAVAYRLARGFVVAWELDRTKETASAPTLGFRLQIRRRRHGVNAYNHVSAVGIIEDDSDSLSDSSVDDWVDVIGDDSAPLLSLARCATLALPETVAAFKRWLSGGGGSGGSSSSSSPVLSAAPAPSRSLDVDALVAHIASASTGSEHELRTASRFAWVVSNTKCGARYDLRVSACTCNGASAFSALPRPVRTMRKCACAARRLLCAAGATQHLLLCSAVATPWQHLRLAHLAALQWRALLLRLRAASSCLRRLAPMVLQSASTRFVCGESRRRPVIQTGTRSRPTSSWTNGGWWPSSTPHRASWLTAVQVQQVAAAALSLWISPTTLACYQARPTRLVWPLQTQLAGVCGRRRQRVITRQVGVCLASLARQLW